MYEGSVMIYFCCEEGRRALIRKSDQPLNGIDHLEVLSSGLSDEQKQRTLRIFFVKPPADEPPYQLLTVLKNGQFDVCVTGGERINNIHVDSAVFDAANVRLDVHLTPRGDFSTYTLWLCQPGRCPPDDLRSLDGLDEKLGSVDFSFKVQCPSDLDCREICACPPAVRVEPELDYLAKDFNSFRQLILDRLSLIAPEWRERNPTDLGITLVELFAYVGDYLSYRQDAIATEAYLGTARQRVSLRRHARLLDYRMHEGCNARAWVQVRLKDGAPNHGVVLPGNRTLLETDSMKLSAGTCFTTDAGVNCVLATDADGLKRILDTRTPEVFEPLHDVFLHPTHQDMQFYTWTGSQCCLPKGAVKAALAGHRPYLAPGQVLVFQEVRGARTGDAADADLKKRHAIRVTRVNGITSEAHAAEQKKGTALDQIIPKMNDALTGQDYTEIEWREADALPFALCLSSVNENGKPIADVSLAQGNLVLADHGRTLPLAQNLGKVREPEPVLAPVAENACGHCEDETPRETPARFRPRLDRAGLTHAQELPKDFLSSPVAGSHAQQPVEALPQIRLFDDRTVWNPQRDLIASEATAPEFVAEIENDGRASTRFGDDCNGMRPAEGTIFHARYRIGNGARGNVGAGALTQMFAPVVLDPSTGKAITATTADLVESITNPLAARGGTEPETMEEVRQYAPQAFKKPRRCVTPEDYAKRAGEHPEVQRAAATIRWTGSWHTIFLTVDRRDGRPITDEFETELTSWLESYRLAGHDLEINRPIFVSLELSLFVCVADGYFRSDVKAALVDAFSARQRPDGSRGFFHPDEWTFSQPVRVSKIYAVAQDVPGVRHVEVRALRRQGATTGPALPAGGEFITGRLEIIRLENDPNFPDHGILKLELRGGR
ncbi:MAG: putative baseplate assembly protein [Verrucomicrobia bacterium]|nr:putative baseplate assembly protein [Verrucomicrobiota bacterium]